MLNDSESHLTQLLSYDLTTHLMHEGDTKVLPYKTSHDSQTYRGQRAVIFDHEHFALVYIDTALYGLPGPANHELAFVIDSRTSKRRY